MKEIYEVPTIEVVNFDNSSEILCESSATNDCGSGPCPGKNQTPLIFVD